MRYTKAALLTVLTMSITVGAFSQSFDGHDDDIQHDSPSLFRIGEAVSPMSSVQMTMGISPFGVVPNYFTGDLTVALSGVISVSYQHENSFGTPLGRIVPHNLLAVRIQLMEQRRYFPAVSVFYRGMVNKRAESYTVIDIFSHAPQLVRSGLRSISFNAQQKQFGIGVTSSLRSRFVLSGLIGIHQFNWQQSWTDYENASNNGQTMVQFPLSKEITLNLFASASAHYRISEALMVHGSIRSMPLLEIEPTTLQLGTKTGYQNSIGAEYQLVDAVRIVISDVYYSGYTHIRNYHHLRVGVNTVLAL